MVSGSLIAKSILVTATMIMCSVSEDWKCGNLMIDWLSIIVALSCFSGPCNESISALILLVSVVV